MNTPTCTYAMPVARTLDLIALEIMMTGTSGVHSTTTLDLTTTEA